MKPFYIIKSRREGKSAAFARYLDGRFAVPSPLSRCLEQLEEEREMRQTNINSLRSGGKKGNRMERRYERQQAKRDAYFAAGKDPHKEESRDRIQRERLEKVRLKERQKAMRVQRAENAKQYAADDNWGAF